MLTITAGKAIGAVAKAVDTAANIKLILRMRRKNKGVGFDALLMISMLID
jgi:hypothetical protein